MRNNYHAYQLMLYDNQTCLLHEDFSVHSYLFFPVFFVICKDKITLGARI
jgi:hypothetical protein